MFGVLIQGFLDSGRDLFYSLKPCKIDILFLFSERSMIDGGGETAADATEAELKAVGLQQKKKKKAVRV